MVGGCRRSRCGAKCPWVGVYATAALLGFARRDGITGNLLDIQDEYLGRIVEIITTNHEAHTGVLIFEGDACVRLYGEEMGLRWDAYGGLGSYQNQLRALGCHSDSEARYAVSATKAQYRFARGRHNTPQATKHPASINEAKLVGLDRHWSRTSGGQEGRTDDQHKAHQAERLQPANVPGEMFYLRAEASNVHRLLRHADAFLCGPQTPLRRGGPRRGPLGCATPLPL